MTDYKPTEWLAARWSREPRWIRDQAKAGKIPGAMKVGRLWRFDRAEIEAHEQSQKAANVFRLSPGAASRRKAS